jgi:hypothetical protein
MTARDTIDAALSKATGPSTAAEYIAAWLVKTYGDKAKDVMDVIRMKVEGK